MSTRAELKTRAKAQLGNGIFQQGWMMALLVILIYGIIVGAASSLVPGLGAMLLAGPLGVGVAFAFLKQSRGDKMEIGDMFKGFSVDFGGTFLLGLMTAVFTFLWSLLFIIPGIVKGYAYSMAYYIKVDHPEYGWNQCLKESIRITAGHKWELFVLDLSFIGWYIVGSLVCGIGTLWVAPYHNATKAQAYEDLKNL